MGLFDKYKERTKRPTMRERMEERYGKKEAESRLRGRQQNRQKMQLFQYERRAKRTSRKLNLMTGEDFPSKPPTPGRTFGLLDILEVFRVLQYPIFNSLKRIGEGASAEQTMESFLKGLTLQEKTIGDDVLEAFGMAEGKGRSLAGLGMDILLDPLNFIGGPLGFTKLGRLSKLKKAGSLADLTTGSRLAKQVLGVFPGQELGGALAKVPDIAADFAAQAKAGQRALVTWRGDKLIQGQAVLENLSPAYETIMAWGPVKWVNKWFNGITNKAAKRMADVARWHHKHMDQQFRMEAAEIMKFLDTAGDDTAKTLIRLNEDPAFISYALIAMVDKGKFPTVGSAKIASARKAAEKIMKRKGLTGDARNLIKTNLRMGFSADDVDNLIDVLDDALGSQVAERLNIQNPVIKKFLKGRKEDFLFNPYAMEELYRVIDPDVKLRTLMSKISVGEGGALSPGVLQRRYQKGVLKATKPYKLPKFKFNATPEPIRTDFASKPEWLSAHAKWNRDAIDTPLFAVHKRHKAYEGAGDTIPGLRASRRTGETHPGPVHVSINNVVDYHAESGGEIVIIPLEDLLNANHGKLYGGEATDLMFSGQLALPKTAKTFANEDAARAYLREATGQHGRMGLDAGLPDVNHPDGWLRTGGTADAYQAMVDPEYMDHVSEAFQEYMNKHVGGFLWNDATPPLGGMSMGVRGQLADLMEEEIAARNAVHSMRRKLQRYDDGATISTFDPATQGTRAASRKDILRELASEKARLQNMQAITRKWMDDMESRGVDVRRELNGVLSGVNQGAELAVVNRTAGELLESGVVEHAVQTMSRYPAYRHRAASLTQELQTLATTTDYMTATAVAERLDTLGDLLRLSGIHAASPDEAQVFQGLQDALNSIRAASDNLLSAKAVRNYADGAQGVMNRVLRESLPAEFFTPQMNATLAEAATIWQGQSEATKQVFRNALVKFTKTKNAPGPLGVMLENGIHEAHIFGYMLHEFGRDPAAVLAQSPDTFFFYNSLFRFGEKGRDAAVKVNGKLLAQADTIHLAHSLVTKMNAGLNPSGVAAEEVSQQAGYFMRLINHHLSRMRFGEARARGPYAKVWAVYEGSATATKAQMKSWIGQTQGTTKRIAEAVYEGSAAKLSALRKSGFVTQAMVEELPKLSVVDRRVIAGKFMSMHQATRALNAGAWDDHITNMTKSYLSGKAFENAIGVYTTLGSSSPGFLGVHIAPKGSEITDILDAIRATPGYTIDDKTYAVAMKMRSYFKGMEEIETSMGILQTSIANYFPHLLAKEAIDSKRWRAVTEAGGGAFSRKIFSSKHRQLIGSLEALNADEIAKHAHKLFIDDPALAFSLRGAAHSRATTYQQLVLDLNTKFGRKLTKAEIANGLEEGLGVLNIRGIGDVVMDKDIVDYVDGFKRLVTNQDELKDFHTTWNTMLSWWKGWTLGIFPAYHARNMVSNISQNYLSGMPMELIPHYHIMARRIQKYGPALTDEFVTLASGKKVSLAEIWEMGERLAVSSSGMYMSEVPEIAERTIGYYKALGRAPQKGGFGVFSKVTPMGARRELSATLSSIPTKKGWKHLAQWLPLTGRKDSKLLATGFLVGRGIENNARWAQFLFSMVEGHTAEAARRRVAKFLFDYDDISLGVASLKKLFPFITWSRKNIPLQISHLAMQPSKMARWAKVKDTIEDMAGTNDIDFPELPEFIRENVPLAYRKLPDGTYQYFLLGNWLAAADVDKIFSPKEMTLNLLFPGLRIPFEMEANYSYFYKSPIDRGIPGDTKRFLGMQMSPKTAHLMRSLRVFAEVNRLFGLGDNQREGIMQRIGRSTIGLRAVPVDPEQEALKRYRDWTDKLGRKHASERYKRQR